MIKLIDKKVWIYNDEIIEDNRVTLDREEGKRNTIAAKIFESHNTSGDLENLKLKFDALASHDITYVGVIETAKASGLKKFPVPYVLTNCHNSLCAVGGTLNEDDHIFGLTAAKKYGGIYVPKDQAVIHQYMREMMAGAGKMILGTDSHTRYGALGTLSIGEGGGEVVKQLLSDTYDIKYPEVICIYLKGKIRRGIGPQDVALAIIREVFKRGFVKNKVMEFIGPGVETLSIDFRNGIDVMTTETACLSSIWKTDDKVLEFYKNHGRRDDFKILKPEGYAMYDGLVIVDLEKIESMIALPFHPSNAYTINELNENLEEILDKVEREENKKLGNSRVKIDLKSKIVNGRLKVDQGEIAGCSGGMYENIKECMTILKGKKLTNDYYALNIYPASTPIWTRIMEEGIGVELMKSGAIIKTAFCGPCFGAGDVPANGSLSIRHTTRNFPNREGAKPGEGQMALVALMDARSIAATSLNGGFLTAATSLEYSEIENNYIFNKEPYGRVFNGFNKGDIEEKLIYGPNIEPWPEMESLKRDMLIKVAAVIKDPVTTTDELIPSGDTSTYRSNPIKLSEFTLSRRVPEYRENSKEFKAQEDIRISLAKGEEGEFSREINKIISKISSKKRDFIENTRFGTVIYARKPGDGSAREQAASCQKVLGGLSNIAIEYATKRYKSNLINWGIIPFTANESIEEKLECGNYIYIKNIKESLLKGEKSVKAILIKEDAMEEIKLDINISEEEAEILVDGCLINSYRKQLGKGNTEN